MNDRPRLNSPALVSPAIPLYRNSPFLPRHLPREEVPMEGATVKLYRMALHRGGGITFSACGLASAIEWAVHISARWHLPRWDIQQDVSRQRKE